ncbi:MAG TPA: DUF4268 domain-containing protein [Flavisolibacter sp.]|jgi:hypothetical protein|nr:DUF4268 domain-containing protein [Flavisolibacter sp.]
MYSRQEASRLRHEFWTAFGQYMSPLLSAEGEKINWINYKTGEKNISFRMHADNKKAVIAIELNHKDRDIQQIYFEEFLQFKNLFSDTMQEEWSLQLHTFDEHWKTGQQNIQGKNRFKFFSEKRLAGTHFIFQETHFGAR